MEIMVYLLLGCAVGIVGALLGIGGGVIIVPVLTFLFDFSPQAAIGTSMFVVLLNSLSGAFGYMRQGKVVYGAAWKFALATIPGALLGGYISEFLRGPIFYLVFGIFFVCFALNMYRKAVSKNANYQADTVPSSYNWRLGAGLSVIIGFLASILGIGGGVMHVPMMNFLMKFPVKFAIATSTAILAVTAIAGTVSHGLLGHIIWMTAICIGIGASVGAQIGVRVAAKAKSTLLMKLTALIVMLTGIKFLMSVIN